MVANNIAMELGTNNVVIIGAFDGLQSPVFPTRVSFYAVAKVWGMSAQEKNACTLKLVDLDTDTVVAEAGEHTFNSGHAYDIHTAISFFENVTLPKSGVYELRAYAGDEVIGLFPLNAGSPKA